MSGVHTGRFMGAAGGLMTSGTACGTLRSTNLTEYPGEIPREEAEVIRAARADELALLSSLAFRSKASWGYSADFMEACREELTVPEHLLGHVFVVESSGEIAGFYSLLPLSDSRVELGHLFVEPDLMRTGLGRQMIGDAIRRARVRRCAALVIQGDPNAADFYTRCGAAKIGDRESESIPGRMLPLFEFRLSHASPAVPPNLAFGG